MVKKPRTTRKRAPRTQNQGAESFILSPSADAGRPPIVTEFLHRSLERTLALAASFGYVEHRGVMGLLRESLIESFLEPLLVPPYRAGTGVIVDSVGSQSGQCDLIIWDDSISRPLYTARGAGIYLIESVVAVVEVKSRLDTDGIRQAFERSREFKRMAILQPPTAEELAQNYSPTRFWNDAPNLLPLSIIFGFSSDSEGSERDRAERVAEQEGIALWEHMQLLVVPGKTSYAFQKDTVLQFEPGGGYNHEVLRPFLAVVDSLPKISKNRGRPRLGGYVRSNNGTRPIA